MSRQSRGVQTEDEARFLERLRAFYEERGYAFTAFPDTADLPGFLGAYQPDAIARRADRSIAIEIKRDPGLADERGFPSARRLFEGRQGWDFRVYYFGRDTGRSVPLPVADPSAVSAGLAEARTLAAEGHRRAAFLLAWSALEAALRTRADQASDRLPEPGTLIQTLAMNGYIEPETERQMRALIDLRNRTVHGDFTADPTTAEIDRVLATVEETLQSEAA